MTFSPDLLTTLRKATRIAVLTGAGISAESGIPTFREAQTGLWAQYDPMELATPDAFRRNPKLVWDWYAWRRELVTKADPNPGHYALAEMERRILGTAFVKRNSTPNLSKTSAVPPFTLITQNIDSLHQRAGSKNIIELHGNLSKTKCFENSHYVETWEATGEVPPRCPQCGSFLRPDVVWFHENLPTQALGISFETAESSEIFFSIGTSALVQPAASLPVVARNAGAVTVEINPAPTPITGQMTFVFEGKAGEILPALVEAVWG